MLHLDASSLVPPGQWASNGADYTRRGEAHLDFVYCGWMELHDDVGNEGDGKSTPSGFPILWGFKPYFWDEEAVFIHTLPKSLGGGLQALERTEDVIFFCADLKHGLVPRHCAAQVIKSRSSRRVDVPWAKSTLPKLVWRWVCPINGFEFVSSQQQRHPLPDWTPVNVPCRVSAAVFSA